MHGLKLFLIKINHTYVYVFLLSLLYVRKDVVNTFFRKNYLYGELT